MLVMGGCLVQTVHRALFVPFGANFAVRAQEAITHPSPPPTSGVSGGVKEEVDGDASEAGDQTPAREGLMETPVAAPSSTNSVISSLEEVTGAMDVDPGKSSGRHEREQGREGARAGGATPADDQALIEGHMYDTDPIVHALRRRARELKGLLGVM